MMLTWQAYRELLRLEVPLFRQDFAAIQDRVRKTALAARRPRLVTAGRICHAVDLAAALYFKPVLCLERSAATVCLLKKHGFAAQMVIGVQQLPFLAHAWVELDGQVLNDKPYVPEIYLELLRCS